MEPNLLQITHLETQLAEFKEQLAKNATTSTARNCWPHSVSNSSTTGNSRKVSARPFPAICRAVIRRPASRTSDPDAFQV